MEIGQRLWQIRHLLGLTQDQMAADVMDRSSYSRIENGKAAIKADELIKLLRAHQVSIGEMMSEFSTVPYDSHVLQDQIWAAYIKQDIERLSQIKKEVGVQSSVYGQIITLLLQDLRHEEVDFFFERDFKHYFFDTRQWDSNVYWFLLVTLPFYKIQELPNLVGLAKHHFDNLRGEQDRVQILMGELLARYIQICSADSRLDGSLWWAFNTLEKMPAAPALLLPKLLAQLYKADYLNRSEQEKEIKNYLKGMRYGKYLYF